MIDWTRPFYDLTYRFSKPRWDTNVPPPELATLIGNGNVKRALDLGCGTGTSAIYFAQHGLQVVGVDFSPRAIAARIFCFCLLFIEMPAVATIGTAAQNIHMGTSCL